jgi:hypothetical protein
MLQTTYRAAAGVFTAVCVVAQYWLLVRGDSWLGMAGSSLRFFSFFTILTNLLAAAALLVPVVAPHSAAGRFLARPTVRTAVTGYIIMVGVIYDLLLRDLSQRQGWPMFFEHMLHYVTPPLFVVDWLAFVDKRDLDWRVGFGALGFPLVYIAWTLVHGALSGWYPYPFVDVADLGYARTLLNIAGLVLLFLALEVVLAAIGGALARRGARGP